MCAALTHVDAHHWASPEGQTMCDDLLERKFTAFVVGVSAVLGTALFVAVTTQSISYCFTIRPILKRLDEAISRLR
jgi:hypothetical protein